MNKIIFGDCRDILRGLDAGIVQCCVTSPPYFGLRDYGHAGQMGLEPTPDEYVAGMVAVFREVRRVLRDDGTLWLNLGDSYAAQRGGTCMPAEMLAGGVAGIGEADSYRGRPGAKGREITRHTQYMPARNASAIGLKHKDLIGIPWRVAFALQADGWYLRQDIIWHKPNPMPESVRDRCTKAHEYLFLLSKSERYYFDAEAMQEDAVCGARGSQFHTGKTGDHQLGRASIKPRESKVRGEFNGKTNELMGREAFRAIRETRNRRSVWTVTTKPYKGAHFATFPPDLIEPCILAGSRPDDIVLDPFMGSGTTAQVAIQHGRQYLGCELNPEYGALQDERIARALADVKTASAQQELPL